jgi:nucleoside-diphosphate-sugar epimerase
MSSSQDIPSNELILITGATGHLGFKSLIDTLRAGYRVRAAIRSDAKASAITTNADFKALNISDAQLECVIVPDLANPGAYDEAVKNVTGILHIASPITTGGKVTADQYDEYFIKPALAGTLGMLNSAAKSPSVKRIVITSSVIAQLKFGDFMQGTNKVLTAEDRIATPEGPFENEFEAYAASKIAALNEAEVWMGKEKPRFDLVSILPSFIEGRNALVKNPEEAMEGTNGVILRAVIGNTAPYALPGNSVHIDDVARLHVEALDKTKIPAGAYVADSKTPQGTLSGTRWEDIKAIVDKHFPEQIKSGALKNTGFQPSVKNEFDVSKTEKTFGWKLQEFPAQVTSVVKMYLDTIS